MSNEVAQPTEQDPSRSTSLEGAKGIKPPALDTSNCMYLLSLRNLIYLNIFSHMRCADYCDASIRC